MTTSRTLHLRLAMILVLAAASCGSCKKDKPAAPAPKADWQPDAPPPPLKLAPVPDAPVIDVEQQAVPGSREPLAVVAARPKGPAEGNFRPTITFSKPVMALGMVEDEASAPPPAMIEPDIPGTWRWLGSSSVERVPSGLVPYSTAFKVTVKRGLKALDGTQLQEDYVFEFHTPGPFVQSIQPSNRSESERSWLTPDQTFTLIMNQPVRELESHLSFEVGTKGQTVPAQVLSEVNLAEERRAKEPERPYARQSHEQHGVKNRQTRYTFKAKTPLPLNSDVKVILGEVQGKEGPLADGADELTPYHTYGPLHFTNATPCMWQECAYGPLMLWTTNHVEPAALKDALVVDPPVKMDWDDASAEYSSNKNTWYVAIPGRYKPGYTYSISVKAGAKDVFGQPADPWKGQVTFADLPPRLELGSSLSVLEADGDGSLRLEAANIRRVDASLNVLTPEQAAVLLGKGLYNWKKATLGTPVQTHVSLGDARNVVHFRPLDLRPALPEGQKTGLVLARVSAEDLPNGYTPEHPYVGLAQITDLAAHAKLGPTSGLVWVTSLKTGGPVADAKVRLLDNTGATLWTGSTNTDGLADVPGLSGLIKLKRDYAWQTPWAMVVVEKDADTALTVSTWNEGLGAYSFGITQAWDGEQPKALGFVMAERGIYRPGDDVMLKGVLRTRALGQLATPPKGARVSLVIKAMGKEVHRSEVALTAFGTFSATVPISKEARLGEYSVRAEAQVDKVPVVYSGHFRVEEYRAPQFRVDVFAPGKELVAGEPLKASVLARYLFGGPMAESETSWSVTSATTSFQPPRNEGFDFGRQSWWWDDSSPRASSRTVASGEALSDAQGVVAVDLGKADAPGEQPYTYTIEAEVTDVNRQRVANRTSIMVHPAKVYAGIRMAQTGFAQVSKPLRMEVVAVTPDGARQTDKSVEVTLFLREWKCIRKQGVGHQWFTTCEPSEQKAGSCQVTTRPTPVACEQKVEKPGFYRIEARVADDEGRAQVTQSSAYVLGDGWVSWQRNDTDKVDLVADKDIYDVGETARILVKSPYPTADALLTVEREGVISRRTIRLTGPANTVEIPLDEDSVPNVFVGLVISRGRVDSKTGVESGADPGRPAIRVGYTQLKVHKKSKRLAVTVEPASQEKQPGDNVTLQVHVANHTGAAVSNAEVTLWAVDEGVLRLTNYKAPDPVEAIHQPRGLSVRTAEPLLHLVLRGTYGDKGEAPPGGGGGDGTGAGFRSNFKTTALWKPDLVTDANGNATVDFKLPDNLTTYRVMAMAVTRKDLFGGGEAQVVVSKPLLALPALPRVARVGDVFEAGVVVHANRADVTEVTVTASATGLELEGAPTKNVQFSGRKAQEVRFYFRANATGRATLRFSVKSGSYTDGVEQKIPIKLPVALETVATYGDTPDQRKEAVKTPHGVRPGVGGLSVAMTSTILGGFDQSMQQLVDYPYGCLEQMSSRLVPFVALREVMGGFGVAYQAPDTQQREQLRTTNALMRHWLNDGTVQLEDELDPDQVVQATVKAIEALQRPDGSFRYWPSSTCSSDWGSVYATLALQRAADVGYAVNGPALKNALDHVRDLARGNRQCCYSACYPPGDTTRAFAAYTLARARAPEASVYGGLYARRQKLPLFAQALLADAMHVGQGDRDRAQTLMTELMNHARETAEGVHFEEENSRTYAPVWSSDTRTTAIVLQTLTDVSPDHPFVGKIGRYLTSVRKGTGRFRNTQEAAFALMALVEVVRTKEKAEPDFVATVALGGNELVKQTFAGRSMDISRQQVPMATLLEGNTGATPASLVFSKKGTGVLYYQATLQYAPVDVPTQPMDRGLVVQRWVEPFAGGGSTQRAYAGDLLRVRVRVGTPQERHYVAVDIPVPSGTEPVDTSLASTAQLPANNGGGEGYEYESDEDVDGRAASDDGPDYTMGFWSPFNHTEMRDDRVLLFADHLPPGVHVYSFVVRATTPGDYVFQSAHAEEMYAPESFGRSEGGRFEVVLAPVTAAK